MPLSVPPRRFDPAVLEMMDRPGQNFELLKQDLRFIARINRWFGGYRIVEKYLAMFMADWPREKPLTILDLATGSADIPRHIILWARRAGLRTEITATDINGDILRVAREETKIFPEIHIERQDLLALPYPPASFDIVLCSLTLHHFSESEAIGILRRIADIAAVGFLVNDLCRSRAAIFASLFLTRFFTRNPIARFDTPTSCARAFTEREVEAMARAADLEHFSIRRHFVCRMALVGRPGRPSVVKELAQRYSS